MNIENKKTAMHAKFSSHKNADLTEETDQKKPDGLLQGLDVQYIQHKNRIISCHIIQL